MHISPRPYKEWTRLKGALELVMNRQKPGCRICKKQNERAAAAASAPNSCNCRIVTLVIDFHEREAGGPPKAKFRSGRETERGLQ